MKKKLYKTAYCSVTPQFPKEAFMAFMHLTYEQHTVAFVPLHFIFTSLAQVQESAGQLEEQTTTTRVIVENHAIFLPLIFEELFPLKRAYWENPLVTYSNDSRLTLFTNALTHFPLYKVLVTPWKLTKKREEFASAIPFYRSATDSDIQKFMLTSDFPVDEKAKYSALYTLGEPFAADWETGERISDRIWVNALDRH